MSIIFDLFLIALVVITVILTAKKGFAKSVVKTVAFVLALILTIFITEPVTNIVYDKFLSEKFEGAVETVFENTLNSAEAKIDEELNAAIDTMPSFISDFVKEKGFSAQDIIDSANPETASPDNLASEFCDKYIKPAALSFLNYIVALLLFIILYFILLLVLRIFAAVLGGGLFGFVDTALGAVLGLVNGAIYATVLCIALTLLSRVVSGDFPSAMIEGSKISQFILEVLPFAI